jgi:NADH:ubiquinone oxidoreductase subunit K
METGLVLQAGAFLFTLAPVGWLLRRAGCRGILTLETILN